MGDIIGYVIIGLIVAAYIGWIVWRARPADHGPDMSFNAIEGRKDAEAARLARALEPIVERAVKEAVRMAFDPQRPPY